MWITNVAFSWHTEHSAQLTQAFTLSTLAFARLNFPSNLSPSSAKYCISQAQKRFCSKNFDSWLGFSCLEWNNGNHLIEPYNSTETSWKCCHPISSAMNCLKSKVTWKGVMLPTMVMSFTNRCRMPGSTKKTQIDLRSQRTRLAAANSWRRKVQCHRVM